MAKASREVRIQGILVCRPGDPKHGSADSIKRKREEEAVAAQVRIADALLMEDRNAVDRRVLSHAG
jgi:hypothetical protein